MKQQSHQLSGQVKTAINRAWDLCEALGIGEWQQQNPSYPSGLASAVRKLDYTDEWKFYIKHSLYDILLVDGSLMQFKYQPEEKTEISFSYIECPIEAMSYEEYLVSTYGDGASDQTGYQWREEYDQYREQCPVKAHVTPVRYDYSPQLYSEGIHPAVHLHIGYNSELRIATRRAMNPVSFALFVIRQCYPLVWLKKFHPHPSATSYVKQIRDELEEVEVSQFRGKDFWEVHLA